MKLLRHTQIIYFPLFIGVVRICAMRTTMRRYLKNIACMPH